MNDINDIRLDKYIKFTWKNKIGERKVGLTKYKIKINASK